MPQIETLMLIGLGFCVAAVIAVMAVKLAWKLAVQTGNRRVRRGNSELKAAGELDAESLKAEYTKLRRRYELKVEDYNTQLAEQLTKLSRARNDTEEVKTSHIEACRQHEARKGKVAEHKATIATLQSDAEEQGKQIETLEEQIAEAGKSAKETADTVTAQRQKLDAANAETDELKAKVATDQSEIADLIETGTANTQSLAEKTSRIAELEVLATNQESDLITGASESATLADELSHVRQDNEKLNTTVRQLSDDLTARTRSLEEASTEIQRIAEDKSATDGQLRKVVGTENERLGTLNRLEQELKQRDEDLARANRELGELQSAKAAIEQDRKASQLGVESRDGAIKLLKGEIADAKSDLEARDSIVIMLRKQIASHEASLVAINEETSALRRRTATEAPLMQDTDTGAGAQTVRPARKKAASADTTAISAKIASLPLASRIRSLQQIITNP